MQNRRRKSTSPDAYRPILRPPDERLTALLAGRTGAGGRGDGLTARQAEALLLVDMQGASLKEAARLMKVSAQSVHALLQRARRHCRLLATPAENPERKSANP